MSSLSASDHSWPIMRQSEIFFNADGSFNEEKLKIATRKGVYPYGLNQNLAKMREHKVFPPKSCFVDPINVEGISDQDYEFGK